MTRKRFRPALVLAACAIAVGAMAAPAPALASGKRLIPLAGTTSINGGSRGSGALEQPERPNAASQGHEDERNGSESAPAGAGRLADGSATPGPGLSSTSQSWSVTSPQQVVSFDGLNHRDQRLANGGNQFSIEPPDQGLCAGAGFVLETVNDVLRVFDTAGNPVTGATDLNTFYGYPAQVNRATGVRGEFVTDPSCHFDVQTRRFYHVALTLDVFPNGDFTGRNHLDIAVSNTSSPAGTWSIFRVPVQNDGTEGTPNHNCSPGPGSAGATHPTACIGDFPHPGADATGFFITTNEFDLFGPNRRAAQIYAFSKRALASGGATVALTQFDTTGLMSGIDGFTIWPTTSPGQQFATVADGTEFFLSSFRPAPGAISNRLAIWALSNTQSLDEETTELTLREAAIPVQTFSRPPRSDQKPGDFPLGQCLNDPTCSTSVIGTPDPFAPEVEGRLDSSDGRILTAVFAGGKVFGALGTAVAVNGAMKAGIAWFVLLPNVLDGGLSGTVLNQGTLSLADNNVIFPAIGVNESGQGVMAFTLSGADFFPSAAFAPIDAVNGAGEIHVIREGQGPQDGFTEYKGFRNPPRPRWGDYGAAAVDGSTVWVASEYIGQTCTLEEFRAAPFGSCDNTRTAFANWGTRISQLVP